MGERLPGLYWVGRLDRRSGVVESETFYRGGRVAEVLSVLTEVGRNPKRAVEVLNEDLEPDGFGSISEREISKVARFAARHPIKTIRRINVSGRNSC